LKESKFIPDGNPSVLIAKCWLKRNGHQPQKFGDGQVPVGRVQIWKELNDDEYYVKTLTNALSLDD
jgi:hypothetical protein